MSAALGGFTLPGVPAELTERGQEILSDLPAYFADDPGVQAACDALARELTRLEQAAIAIRGGTRPTVADDAYRLLSVWEQILGLPVAPAGVTVSQRSGRVLSAFRSRRAARGTDWVRLLTEALGTESWSHAEVSPYSVTILMPQAAGSVQAEQALALARRITPANMTITVLYDQGFVIGSSQIGISPI